MDGDNDDCFQKYKNKKKIAIHGFKVVGNKCIADCSKEKLKNKLG
jgi:hypothetical protein